MGHFSSSVLSYGQIVCLSGFLWLRNEECVRTKYIPTGWTFLLVGLSDTYKMKLRISIENDQDYKTDNKFDKLYELLPDPAISILTL